MDGSLDEMLMGHSTSNQTLFEVNLTDLFLFSRFVWLYENSKTEILVFLVMWFVRLQVVELFTFRLTSTTLEMCNSSRSQYHSACTLRNNMVGLNTKHLKTQNPTMNV